MNIHLEQLLNGVHGQYKLCAIKLQLKDAEVEIGPPERFRAKDNSSFENVVLQVCNEHANVVEIEYQPAILRKDKQWRFFCDGNVLKVVVPYRFWKTYLAQNGEAWFSNLESFKIFQEGLNPVASHCHVNSSACISDSYLGLERERAHESDVLSSQPKDFSVNMENETKVASHLDDQYYGERPEVEFSGCPLDEKSTLITDGNGQRSEVDFHIQNKTTSPVDAPTSQSEEDSSVKDKQELFTGFSKGETNVTETINPEVLLSQRYGEFLMEQLQSNCSFRPPNSGDNLTGQASTSQPEATGSNINVHGLHRDAPHGEVNSYPGVELKHVWDNCEESQSTARALTAKTSVQQLTTAAQQEDASTEQPNVSLEQHQQNLNRRTNQLDQYHLDFDRPTDQLGLYTNTDPQRQGSFLSERLQLDTAATPPNENEWTDHKDGSVDKLAVKENHEIHTMATTGQLGPELLAEMELGLQIECAAQKAYTSITPDHGHDLDVPLRSVDKLKQRSHSNGSTEQPNAKAFDWNNASAPNEVTDGRREAYILAEDKQGFQAPPSTPNLEACTRYRPTLKPQVSKSLKPNKTESKNNKRLSCHGEKKTVRIKSLKDKEPFNGPTLKKESKFNNGKLASSRSQNVSSSLTPRDFEAYERIIKVRCYRPRDSASKSFHNGRSECVSNSSVTSSTGKKTADSSTEGTEDAKMTALHTRRNIGLQPLRGCSTSANTRSSSSCENTVKAEDIQTCEKVEKSTSPMTTPGIVPQRCSFDKSSSYFGKKSPSKSSIFDFDQPFQQLIVGKFFLDDGFVAPMGLWRGPSNWISDSTSTLNQSKSYMDVMKTIVRYMRKELVRRIMSLRQGRVTFAHRRGSFLLKIPNLVKKCFR